MVSRDTPSQCVPSFDHRVTQCRSTVMFSVGSSRNDFQFHRRKTFVPSSIVNSHFSSAMWGVGPAERTGKSVVRYCPGGSFTSATVRLPKKPREMVPIRTSPMRERANWLKLLSLIGKTNFSLLKRHITISAVSTPAATNQTAILEGRGFQIADTSLLQRMPSSGPMPKRTKTAHI